MSTPSRTEQTSSTALDASRRRETEPPERPAGPGLGSPQSKREQILQGAMRVFLRQGYANTSMDRVAAEAGVSKQTIYSHFQDKEGLFIALIERITIHRIQAELGEEFAELEAGHGAIMLHGEPAVLLRRLAEAFLCKMTDQEYLALLRVVIGESARFPELAQLYTQTVIQKGLTALSTYFQSHPELNIVDPEATARIFIGSLVAFLISQEILAGKLTMPMDKERLINRLIACVLGAPAEAAV